MDTCQEYKEWIEERWEEPIQKRKQGYKEECKKKKCKKLCLCCNKWLCSIVTFWYWLVEWVIRIIAKWIVYVICRIIAAIITFLWAIAFWLRALICLWISKDTREKEGDVSHLKDLGLRSDRKLRLQVVIIDKNDKTLNPITEQEIDNQIAVADRILRARAHIAVSRKGAIRRSNSVALYEIEGHNVLQDIGEWLKHIAFVIGRESPRHLTVFAVGRIKGTTVPGVHYPLYGSVFIEAGGPDILLCHELGHALLNLDNMAHRDVVVNLMYTYQDLTQNAVLWPADLPVLDVDQWCAMRQSRWLDWDWSCEKCP